MIVDVRTFLTGLAVTFPVLMFALLSPDAFILVTWMLIIGAVFFVITWAVGKFLRSVIDI